MTKQKTIFILVALLSIGFLLTASPVFAAGLVPCGGQGEKMCTVCDFYKLIKNIIDLILYIFASLATLMAVYIAYLFMFSGGSPKVISDAKGKLWLLIKGIFFVLGSWLILNTIINLLVSRSVFTLPWNQIDCEALPSAPSPTRPEDAPGFETPDETAPGGPAPVPEDYWEFQWNIQGGIR